MIKLLLLLFIIFIIILQMYREYFTTKIYYEGKNIEGAKKIMYCTPIPIILSPKHGNQTRVLSTLKYFINNKYNIILISDDFFGWSTDVIKYLNDNNVTIYITRKNNYMEIYNKEKPDIVFINYIHMLDKNMINNMKNTILDLHDCPVTNTKMYRILHLKIVDEYSDFTTIENIINKSKNNIYDLSEYKIDYLIHIAYDEYLKYKKFNHINHIYIPYYEKPKIILHNEYNYIEHTDIIYPYKEINKIIFVASDNDFNVFAFKFFFKHILPKIILEIPDFKLYVYGIICNKIQYLRSPHIIYKGFVKDKTEIYTNTSFAICPLLFGTGAKIKVFEALSYNVPVVSYNFSGTIELKHNINGLIANNSDEFIKYIIELYKNKELLEKLSNNNKLNYNILNDELNIIIKNIKK